MVAVALIHGALTADHYEDVVAADLRIDALRAKVRAGLRLPWWPLATLACKGKARGSKHRM